MLVISFTGHRPNKLGGYNWNTPKNKLIMEKLEKTILNIVQDKNPTSIKFITGGALGIDQMAFFTCNKIKSTSKIKVTLEVAVPFKDQPKSWISVTDMVRYKNILARADVVTFVDELEHYARTNTAVGLYNPYKLQIRNEYMVDCSDLLIAVWDGSKSGTYNCISYAKKCNKEVIIINPNEI